MVLVDAMVRAGWTDPAGYASRLFDSDYSGVTWRYSFDASGELTEPVATVYAYRGAPRVAFD